MGIEEQMESAGKPLLSLDEPSDSVLEKLRFEEADRRVGEYCGGSVRCIPADEVLRGAMDEIS